MPKGEGTGTPTVAEHLHGVLKADECLITTRSCDSQLPAISGRPLVSHDARYHFDPGSLSYRAHVGRHPAIIAGDETQSVRRQPHMAGAASHPVPEHDH